MRGSGPQFRLGVLWPLTTVCSIPVCQAQSKGFLVREVLEHVSIHELVGQLVYSDEHRALSPVEVSVLRQAGPSEEKEGGREGRGAARSVWCTTSVAPTVVVPRPHYLSCYADTALDQWELGAIFTWLLSFLQSILYA